MSQLTSVIKQSMTQYAGAVIQSRALVDVRDGLKPSARQILYCMDMCKYTSDKPFQASAAVVGDAMKHFYIHGDASCLGVVMRAGQPFAMRYPLVDVGGNGGSLMESGNWAAARYTKSRLSKLSDALFNDIKKDTIDEWRDNFSDTEQYPAVLPSKGYYNICNGTSGIATGLASSVPQYNLREMNAALIYLIDHPDCDFDAIYCAPDFATGAILLNEADVKESMKTGSGAACKLRSVVEYDAKERCLVVTEIPYGVYTNTICQQLEEIINGDNNPGIERFNDLTGERPLIKIYLTKSANPDKILTFLYKNTSLQSYFGINFTMLDMGRFPKVFTWKEMLQAHIDHERVVYQRGFEFDLRKIENRIHIIDGLRVCLVQIDEVITVIKNSTSTAAASTALQEKFLLDEEQAKAVLDMKLSRLARLEVKKLEDERASLQKEADRIHAILADDELFKNEIKNGWRAIADKFGDSRRTQIMDLASDTNDEPVEIKSLQISVTNQNNVFVTEISTLYKQRRGTVGTKFKLDKGEYVVNTVSGQSIDELLLFTQTGIVYHCSAADLPLNTKISITTLVSIKDGESICAATMAEKVPTAQNIIFITKHGMLKKSLLSDYNISRGTGLKAIALDDGDTIVSVLFTNSDRLGILTNDGNCLIIDTQDVRPIGRIAKGVRGIKLNDGCYVVAAHLIPKETQYIASISAGGLCKQSNITDFSAQGRATKGARIQRLNDDDTMADFLPLTTTADLMVVSTQSCIKLSHDDIPISGRATFGVKSIKLAANSRVVRLYQT